MLSLHSIATAGLLAAALASAQNSTECVKGLKVFVARGTNETLNDAQSAFPNLGDLIGLGETMGLGMTGTMLKPIFDQIDDSGYSSILYPATDNDPVYFQSVANGTLLVREAMTQYAKACPDSKMAWLGYSQGAQIISNNLCGMGAIWAYYAGDEATITELLTPVPTEVSKNIVAVVLMGDPSYSNGTDYNHGTFNQTGSGVFYRHDFSACNALGKRIRSYCDAGDPFCDVGDFFQTGIHTQYVQNHGEEIISFVVEQFNNGGDSGGADPAPSDGERPVSGASAVGAASSFAILASALFFSLS